MILNLEEVYFKLTWIMIQNNTLNFLAVRLKIVRVNVSKQENCV